MKRRDVLIDGVQVKIMMCLLGRYDSLSSSNIMEGDGFVTDKAHC